MLLQRLEFVNVRSSHIAGLLVLRRFPVLIPIAGADARELDHVHLLFIVLRTSLAFPSKRALNTGIFKTSSVAPRLRDPVRSKLYLISSCPVCSCGAAQLSLSCPSACSVRARRLAPEIGVIIYVNGPQLRIRCHFNIRRLGHANASLRGLVFRYLPASDE